MRKFIFMLVATLMLAIGTVNAQEQSNYAGSSKFTDNVSVTLQGGVLTTFNDFYTGHTAMAPIAVLGVDKYINPWFGVGVEGRTLIGTGRGMYNAHTTFDAVNVSGYTKFNILNMFNYNGERKFFEPVVYTGLGWGHQTCSEDGLRNYMTYRAGAEFNFNLGKEKAWAIVVNPSVVWGDINNGKLIKQNGNFEVTAGVVYHFKTSNGKHSIAKAKLYDYEEVKLLNNRINSLVLENKALKNKLTAKPKEVYSEKTIVNNVDNSYTILFEQGKSTVRDITPIVNALKQNNKNITIIGNISPEGSERVNKALALARAKSVRKALIKAGISADRITITNGYANQRRATIIVH